jgi:hypothetical protein
MGHLAILARVVASIFSKFCAMFIAEHYLSIPAKWQNPVLWGAFYSVGEMSVASIMLSSERSVISGIDGLCS